MSTRRDDDALLSLAFSVQSNPGAYALLLGAGVSAGAVPTAWEVLEDLCRRVAAVEGDDAGEDPVGWWESKFGLKAEYGTVLKSVARTPLERQRLLEGFFERTPEDVEAGRKSPTAAHEAIARLAAAGVVRVIVTLNFDMLLEEALRAAGVEPTVVSSPADVRGMPPLHTIKCCVIHLHGDYKNPASMLNTVEELSGYDPARRKLLLSVLSEYGLVVAGWSAKWDVALRDAVAGKYPPNRFSLTWVEPFVVGESAASLLALKDGHLMATGANEAFGRLADAVDAVRVRHAGHPLAVPVAVETAKRALSGRSVAIELHDQVSAAFVGLHAAPDVNITEYGDDAQYGGYAAIVGRVEEAVSLPAALVATLAYWGDESHDRWWLSEVERFAVYRTGNGLTALMDTRALAGLRLFYAAGVAAVARGRYDLLGSLFRARVPNPYDRGRLETLNHRFVPTRVLGSAPGKGFDFFARFAPFLGEVLGLGEQPVEDAWQQFELLRLAAPLLDRSEFRSLYATYANKRNDVVIAQTRLSDAVADHENEIWENNVRAAQGEVDAVFSNMVNLVSADYLHVMTERATLRSYVTPMAERLAADLDAERETHPLVMSNAFTDPDMVATAIRAAGAACAAVGEHTAVSRITRDGFQERNVWLDSYLR